MAASSSDETSQRPVVLVRMIHFGIEVGVAMKVMAFWIWLETQGFREIMRKILLHDDRFLTLVAKEAEDILSFLKQLSTNPIPPELMRFTPKLARHFLSLSIILADKEKALKEVKKSGSEKDGVAAKPIAPYGGSKLSPSAKEWNPLTERAAEETRCLFLTFSNGYPLTEIQISRFFRMNYGSCVERVYVHRPEPKDQNLTPLFGKVVFTASYIPAMILDGKTEAKFWVDAKPLWGKRFEP
ncbi:hypothetical protein OIU74_007284 [Salix koriyanagi]|uniref:Uncharacterized protein n=1 Tax=Salix koriyanagi TaxID=2511006 RepID=A0A9Q0Z620_9ROSI|nr:hypothetical protein OIU74_007284 [Salix koriyanagi]